MRALAGSVTAVEEGFEGHLSLLSAGETDSDQLRKARSP